MRNLGTCERVMAQLSDYLDEDLDGESGVEVEKHLRGCGPCQAFADSLRRIIELCRAHEPGVKPRALTPSARAELERAWQKTLAGRQDGSNQGT
jgi:predicted anti-sigma-YlaC factor YlaD